MPLCKDQEATLASTIPRCSNGGCCCYHHYGQTPGVPKDAKFRASTKALCEKEGEKKKDNLDICRAPCSGLDPQGDSGGRSRLELATGVEGSKEMVQSTSYLCPSPSSM